jgi:hypothetical protein
MRLIARVAFFTPRHRVHSVITGQGEAVDKGGRAAPTGRSKREVSILVLYPR